MAEKCIGERFAPPWTPEVIYCDRDTGHIGKHQNFSRKSSQTFPYTEVVWDSKGATTKHCLTSKYWNECDECNILIPDDATHCGICTSWKKVLDMPKENHIIIDRILFLVNPKSMPEGREELTVLWLDHSRPALVSEAIYRFSDIPEYYQEALPDNAKFKPREALNGGLFVPYGKTVQKDKVEEFLANYGRLE